MSNDTFGSERLEDLAPERRPIVHRLISWYLRKRGRPLFDINNCTVFFNPKSFAITDDEDEGVVRLRSNAGEPWAYIIGNTFWADDDLPEGAILVVPNHSRGGRE